MWSCVDGSFIPLVTQGSSHFFHALDLLVGGSWVLFLLICVRYPPLGEIKHCLYQHFSLLCSWMETSDIEEGGALENPKFSFLSLTHLYHNFWWKWWHMFLHEQFSDSIGCLQMPYVLSSLPESRGSRWHSKSTQECNFLPFLIPSKLSFLFPKPRVSSKVNWLVIGFAKLGRNLK